MFDQALYNYQQQRGKSSVTELGSRTDSAGDRPAVVGETHAKLPDEASASVASVHITENAARRTDLPNAVEINAFFAIEGVGLHVTANRIREAFAHYCTVVDVLFCKTVGV